MKRPLPKRLVLRIRKAKWFQAFLWVVLLGLTAGLGALFGAFYTIRHNLPPVSDLENLHFKTITTVYDVRGEPVKEFADERRVEIPFDQIPEVLIQAILATEDPRFFNHRGVDVIGILRAFKEDVSKVLRGRRLEGGSTITQQLATRLFFHREQSLRRKLKEAFLSLQIEKKYTKQKILELYCNQFSLGVNGIHGVESAANQYFGKKAADLTLEEAAMIAGIFRGPTLYSPYRNPELTLDRRNHVLNRMAEAGYLTRAQAEAAQAVPVQVLPQRRTSSEFGAYFFEDVRKSIVDTYGEEALDMGGLKVYTTIDPDLQKYAETALRNGLRDWENAQKGWRKDKRNLVAEGRAELETELFDFWPAVLEPGEVYEAVVLEAGRTEAVLRVKDHLVRLPGASLPAWTRTKNPDKLMTRGDVVQVKVTAIDEAAKTIAAALDQHPLVQGSFVAVDPATGQIRAMVGGYSFARSQFNRTVQRPGRPTGSAIKPFFYTAAIDSGRYSPATVIVDEPATWIDEWSDEPWSPQNYDRQYKGAITLRKGLEESRNIVTAKLLDYISPQAGIEYCRRFGITATLYPYLSLSLGTFEMPLLELVSAFSVYPNKGRRVRPYFISRIEDKDGNVLEETRVESEEVVSPQTAYIMTSLLQGVVQRGTAVAAASLNWPLGGKTGTTDTHTDAWFVGFSPSLCAGVWVGYDSQVNKLGDRQTGGLVALPIWKSFFTRVIEDRKKELADRKAAGLEAVPEDFEVPGNLSFVDIDRKTGLLLTPICMFPFREVFFPGTEPTRFCSHEEHLRVLSYYGDDKGDGER